MYYDTSNLSPTRIWFENEKLNAIIVFFQKWQLLLAVLENLIENAPFNSIVSCPRQIWHILRPNCSFLLEPFLGLATFEWTSRQSESAIDFRLVTSILSSFIIYHMNLKKRW